MKKKNHDYDEARRGMRTTSYTDLILTKINRTKEIESHEGKTVVSIFFAAKDGEALYSQQKQDWELTGSDHELLIAKFRLKLKKVGKTTRPSRYDLNQIPYDYTVEVRNRFKGLDLIDRVPDEL